MASHEDLQRTIEGSFAARLVELGSGDEVPDLGRREPLVSVHLEMPLSDARRFGKHLYDWVELVVPPLPPPTEHERLLALLSYSVDTLEFSVRTANCLYTAEIRYIGDLVKCSENDLLRLRHFGKRSLKEVTDILGQMDLSLGMDVQGWSPEDPS